MAQVWSIDYLESFTGPPKQTLIAVERSFESAPEQQLSRASLKKLMKKKNVTDGFTRKWEALEKTIRNSRFQDRYWSLKIASDEGGVIPDVFELRHRNWTGYYHVDSPRCAVTGLLALYKYDPPPSSLRATLNRLVELARTPSPSITRKGA